MTATPSQPDAWYALRHLSNRAFAVRDALRAEGIIEFLPTYSVETRWTDRTKRTARPLFAGYIFARFDPARACKILQTPGVFQILSVDQKPEPIPDKVIESLRRVAESPVAVACCPYVAGVTVTVMRGPFAGVCGVVRRTQGATTLTIPVEILGRSVGVQIDAGDVREVAK
jgi:transcription antitermination factor NusG